MSEIIISVVEDNGAVCKAARRLAELFGFKVEAFQRVEDFLKSDRPRYPSCLILDMQLPGLNGLQLRSLLQATAPGIPIIYVTAHYDEEVRDATFRAGAVNFLCKPFSDEVLLEAIRAALKTG